MISLGAALSLAALGVSGFLAVFVFGMNPRGRANRAFLVLMLTFVAWDAFEAIIRSLPSDVDPAAAYAWEQLSWVAISTVPAALMHLALRYPEERPLLRRGAVLVLVYAPVLGWAYLIYDTGYLIDGLTVNPLGPAARVGSAYPLLALLYGVWFYAAVALYVAAWLRVRGRTLGRVQGLVVAGLLLATVPAGLTEIFWPSLTGADTRLGLASVYTLLWSVFLAVSVSRYGYLVIEPVVEARGARRPQHPVEAGLNYLVVETGRTAGMDAFRELVSAVPGLCVTGLHPSRVAERFGLERTPVLWITNASSDERTVRPQGLEFELLHTVLKFLRVNRGAAVLLDDLDYLAAVNGFAAVARFLKRVANQASASGGTLVTTVGAGTFRADEMAILKGCVDRVIEVHESLEADVVPERYHRLFILNAQDAALALPLLTSPHGLLLTTDHPAKSRRRFGDRFEVLWVADRPEDGVSGVRPSALDTEGKRAVTAFLNNHSDADLFFVGLEQFVLLCAFQPLLLFTKDVLDLADLRGARLVATLTPNALPPREVIQLARRFDRSGGPAVLRPRPSGGLPTAAAGSRTPSRGPAS